MNIPPTLDQQLTPEQIKFLRQSWQVMNYLLSAILSEIRTPTTASLGWSELLLEEKLGPLNEQQRKGLSSISKSNKLLLAIWDDLFVMQPVLSGRLNLSVEEINLHQLIQQAITATEGYWLLSSYSNKPVIEQNLPNELSHIWVDGLRIQQVITRLLLEAVSGIYSSEKSEIVVTVSCDEVWATIQVRAIGGEIQYFGDDNSPNLFFSRIVSEMHGGQMQLEKQEAELGFTLTLPIYQNRKAT